MSLIAAIEGAIERKTADAAIVRVGGGVFLRVYVPSNDLAALPSGGESARLFTHLVVREDDLQLYGFATEQGLRLFELLIGVSQIGPKVALAVLSALSPQDLAVAIAAGDARTLSRAPGIGRRTADRIILELGGRLEDEFGAAFLAGTSAAPVAAAPAGDLALQWLLALGYSAFEARQALSVEREEDLETDERVRRALQRMGGGTVGDGPASRIATMGEVF